MSVDQPEAVVENLRQERLNVQKKTFTKWANVHLQKHGLQIDDLFVDLGDGLRLMKLLESLTGEKLGKPAKGSARINKIENVSRCLAFLHSKKMRLENISSEDIVDGKPHLILGLLWTIILRCEIWNVNNVEGDRIIIPQPPPNQNIPVQKIAKDSLLLWCQNKTDRYRYKGVKVKDFHRSWRDGLAFNALIHSHLPSLVDFDALKAHEHTKNLESAFNVASKHIGVPKLLDPEDVDTDNPDEKSIIIYVSMFSKGLAKVGEGMTAGKRITNILLKSMEIDNMKKDYNKEATDLLSWINSKVEDFQSMEPLRSLEDIQQEIYKFKDYRLKEKPIKIEHKNEIEALLFAIQMKRLGQAGWIPSDEISPAEIEKAWRELERAEHDHEYEVRNQLKEQERLENLAYKFESKRTVRENYLKEMQKVLTDPNYGSNIKQADATFKKHEAIRTGIISKEIMILDIFKIADTLINANYRRKDEIIEWKNGMEENWNYVLRLLEAYDEKFANLRQVMSILEETDVILEEMNQLQTELDSENEPVDVDSSLQRLAVKEVQVAFLGETIERLDTKIESQVKAKDAAVLHNQLLKLRQAHQRLVDTSAMWRDTLEDRLRQTQQLEQLEEMMAWIQDQQMFCTSDTNYKDLSSAIHMQKKHKALGSELVLKKELSKDIVDKRLNEAFEELEESWKEKGDKIEFAIDSYQYSTDADKCVSWISEKLHLLSSLDCGSDDFTCEALLRRHLHMQREISTDVCEIQHLRKQADSICKSISDRQETNKSQEFGAPMKCSQAHISEGDSIQQALTKAQIYDRQAEIENLFSDLQRKCEERRLRLSHNNMFFRFKDGCTDIERWMREKERMLDTNDFGKEADEIEKNFEEYITALASRGLVIDELKNLALTLEVEKADQANTAKMLYHDVYRRWQHLHDLTSLKEKNLKGFTSVLLAHRVCDETSNWLKEKCEMENLDDMGDIRSLDILRRKQEAIERELLPAEERVKQAHILAENVANSYPDQTKSIQKQTRNLNDQLKMFQKKIEERKQILEDSAGLQIFNTSLNSLVDWSHLINRKLNVREKIGDLVVAESVVKEHKDLGDEIVVQDERFQEVQQLGEKLANKHKNVEILVEKLQDAQNTVHDSWQNKQIWLQQSLDLQVFNREADQLNSMCTTQETLLHSSGIGETLSDVEMQLRHHDAFTESLMGQDARFSAFQQMAETLIAADHVDSNYIRSKCDQVLNHRQNTKENAETRKFLLLDAYEFQEFRADAHEMFIWISEKSKLAADIAKQDSTSNILYKMKRQKTFEAEIAANQCRFRNIYSIGENIINKDSTISPSAVHSTLEDLETAWQALCDDMEINRQALQQEIVLRDFSNSVESVLNKLENIWRSLTNSSLGRDLRSTKSLLKALEMLELEKDAVNLKVSDLIEQGENLIQTKHPENRIKNLKEEMQQKSDSLEGPLEERKIKLQTCLKFFQFKSDVDRELVWISEQLTTLPTPFICRNLLDAQKFQKKIDNFEIAFGSHKAVVESLQEKVLVLVTEEECPVDVTQPCTLMKQQWNILLQEFIAQKEKASMALKSQSFMCEAGEIDSWIIEKLEILSNTDYGKDEDAVVKLLTKHKAIELEIDSYKGLVDELASQADAMIESNHPDSKIIKNRMEVINQEMNNIQKLCTVKREKLLESKSRHEFINETEDLKAWISEQMAEATSEEFGEDYEHVLVLHQNFEFFRAKVEGGSKRILQYEEFAKRLINSNCYFISDVENSLEELSESWSGLMESIEARAFKTEAAAEIHRYHRDVTDILFRINSYYRTIPQDLGNNRIHVQDLIKKHDTTENELLGIEAQVHILLEDSRHLQDAYPGGNEEHIQMQLALVIEHWNLLQQKVSSRKVQLLNAERIHKFLASAREEESWAKETILELVSETIARDVQQMENDYKLMGIDIETRLGHFEVLTKEGQTIMEFDIFKPTIEEKLKSLSDIQKGVREAWERKSVFVQQKKNTYLFFHEAKQIQASFAKREVQLCGSENKETVEDIDKALKKHLEFQKSMDVQEEKFMNWKEQGQTLLKQRNEDSPKIEKKIQDLSERRERLLDFTVERTKSLSEALQLAKFKRDTIEAEAWLQEKKNKLRHVLKDYNQLSDEEKIKCLQKQQAVQAELDVHEPFINNIIQQSKEVVAGQEVKTRLQLILEDWEEVKENSARIGNDLKQAREMLLIHDMFEKTDAWIKEKELMIQANEVGKDYEHCLTIQSKLDDVHSDKKVDESLLKQMKELAFKLSRKETQEGVYIRYERICDRWNWLKEEIQLYRKKLKDATQVHSFVKDIDETIQRIREKNLILSSREETTELSVVQSIQRKLELLEKDLTALDHKIKVQDNEAHSLAERYQLSAGRIMDKINEAHRERKALDDELKAKKQYMDAANMSLKFVKDVNDFAILVHEMVKEIEFGEMPSNSIDTQSLLRSHNDLQAQIVSRQKEIKELQESGKSILRIPNASSKGIENSLKNLQEMNNDLDIVWQNRLTTLLQCRDMQLFLEKAKLVENWLATKEAFVAIQNTGDSMSSVEALIRKQEMFEETCFANFEKIKEIEMMVRDLKDHDEFQTIQSRCEDICKRRDALREACVRRKEILQESKAFQQLLLEMYEISNWMSAKIRVASDDSYRDLKNLLSKSQKHAAFEAEILANHTRVMDFKKQADTLIENNNFAYLEIQQHVEHLEGLWERLMNATNSKKDRLREAYEALQCKHKLDDINNWLEEIEAQIEFDEYDSNVAALQIEINKNKELQKVAEDYAENLRLLKDFTEEFEQKNHLSKDEIISMYKSTMQRFRSVENTLSRKGNNLQESYLLAGVENDINDELSWIEENIKTCEDDQPYHNVMSVQALQKNLQALETEIVSREPLIASIIDRGLRSKNGTAETKIQELEQRFNYLKACISLKRLRLADALEAQTYYFEATQAEMWMKEKLAQVIGCDIERDVYSVQSVQKKLGAVEAATDGFRHSIQTLQELSSNLIERGHFDGQNIQSKQEEVNDLYEELRQNILKKTAILREKEDYFLFERDVRGLINQLKAMSNISSSADQGRDVEHVESLLQKYEAFKNRLRCHESAIEILKDRGDCLIEEAHSESENVEDILKELDATWFKCKESAETRYKALEKEKTVYSFYKSVDETASWIYEKDVALSSDDYSHDLESIKTLLKHHDTLEGDLKAIEEQIQALKEESDVLSNQFPDSKEDIDAKFQEVSSSWKDCIEKSANRKDKLLQAEQIQSYFDEARDFHDWIYEMTALITSHELPEDVETCEALLAQYEGYKSEIDSRFLSFYNFEARGHEITESGHFMSEDVQTKLNELGESLKDLLNNWEARRNTYEQTLDLQLFRKKLLELESWLNSQEHNLGEENGRSVEEVEYLIQKHEQFQKKVELYEVKFQELVESTKAEEDIMQRKEAEEIKRLEDEKLLQQQKIEEIRRKEEERLLEERKRNRIPTIQSEINDPALDYVDQDKLNSFKREGSRIWRPNKDRTPSGPPILLPPDRSPSPIVIPKHPPKYPPTRAEGFLARKQELQSGRKRATSRQWKTLYTVLCGQLMCFFKDKKAFLESSSAKPPVNILNAHCFVPKDYHKRKFVFRLELSDSSAFLFEAPNNIKREEWMQKINFTANLSPSQQLMSTVEETQFTTTAEEEKFSLGTVDELYSSGDERLHKADEESQITTVSDSQQNFLSTPVFQSPQQSDSDVNFRKVYNDFYDDPFEETERSLSITSQELKDANPESARSSLSNQSSYVTAAASNSSISTLQEDRIYDVASSDEDWAYANTTPRGSFTMFDTEQRNYAMPDTPRGSYAMPDTPRGSYAMPDTPRGSYAMPDTPRGSYAMPDTPRGSYAMPDAPQGSYAMPDAPQRNYVMPDSPRESFVVPHSQRGSFTMPDTRRKSSGMLDTSSYGNYDTPDKTTKNFSKMDQPPSDMERSATMPKTNSPVFEKVKKKTSKKWKIWKKN